MIYTHIYIIINKNQVNFEQNKELNISALQNKWSLKFNQSYFMLRQMYLAFSENHTFCSSLQKKLDEVL